MQGKMNKDLDERLIPNGEYRDALNIEVTTSEGSNIGSVENIIGNKSLNLIQFREPFYDGEQQAFDRDGLPIGFGSTTSGPYTTSFSSAAEVVASVSDERTGNVYCFTGSALSYKTTNDIDGSGTHLSGIKTDVIFEYNDKTQRLDYIFVDVYASKRQWGLFNGGQINAKANITSAGAQTASAGVTEIRLYQSAYWNYLNGLEVGMTAKLLNSNGTNLWAEEGKVVLKSFTPVYDDVSPYIKIVLDKEVSNTDNDNILFFEKEERLLNFVTAFDESPDNNVAVNLLDETYLDSSGTVTSYTPSTYIPRTNKITAVNVFDGLIYFTDGRSEPKKINIERSRIGTNNSLYKTTEFLYQDHLQEYQRSKMNLEDVTVIKRSPLQAPDMDLHNTLKIGDTSRVGIQAIDLSSFSAGDPITGGLTIIENQEGNLIKPLKDLAAPNDNRGWGDGDKILLQSYNVSDNGGFEVTLKIVSYNYAAGTFTAEFESANAAYIEAVDVGAISWEASLIEKVEPLFEEKFVRFATRWRYSDNEVSAISPFTNVAFIPKGLYSFSAKEAFNTSMVNDVRKIVLHRFIPFDIPKEVEEVDVLYREDGNTNIYLLKTIKRKDKRQAIEGGTTVYPWVEDGPLGSSCRDKGVLEVVGSTYGSVIPSNQILRPFDNVPRKAKAQEISASRLIYGNYTQGYDLVDSTGSNIDLSFINWNGGKGVASVRNRSTESINSVNSRGALSIKSGRTYTLGVVYKDKFGRESSVLIGENSSIQTPYSDYDPRLISVFLNNPPPPWAEYFKFFVKENSNEYYNISLYRAFSSNPTEDNKTTECWLIFNSSDRNKVSEGDYLIPKMAHRFSSPTPASANVEFKIIEISNETPKELFDGDDAAPGFDPSVDQDGKFFVKVKNSATLTGAVGINTGDEEWYNWLNPGIASPASAVFEVKPDPKIDIDVFYEIPRTYPIKLTYDNVNNWATVGDRVYIYYKSIPSSAIIPDFYNGELDGGSVPAGMSSPGYNLLSVAIQSIEGPRVAGGLTKVVLDTDITFPALHGAPAPAANTLAKPGSVHIVKKDGSKVVANLAPPVGYAQYGIGGATNTIYLKSDTVHNNSIYLPFFNCFSFHQGVESNRIRDDFNATTIDNGVKVSTTSENYKEQQRKNGLIFSGIYNSKNGVNNLNQFITAEGITKDLNPQFGSIQKMNSRDTDITVCCEDKVVKVLANKDALFTASGANQVTSTKNVLGQTVPYQGEYGIGKNPESFVTEEYRSYFVDKARGAVIRLSKDGLTNIALAGMGDYFGDTLKTAEACVGAYNRDKGEYDLTIYYDYTSATQPTARAKTISYNESIKGWSSFKSYYLESGVSLNNTYYTFKKGETYEHTESATVNNFYGVQFYSSITPVVNEMPSSVKSFMAVNYEGTQARILELDDDSTHDLLSPGYQEYYNNTARRGWYLDSITTNKQTGKVLEFKEKEGKWFNYIHGDSLVFDNSDYAAANLDTQEFSVQGLGRAQGIEGVAAGTYTIAIDVNQITGTGYTVTGSSATIVEGTNLNTLNGQLTITWTPDSCYEIDVDDFDFADSLPSWIASYSDNWEAGDLVYSNGSAQISFNLTGTASGDLTFVAGDIFFANGVENVCLDHQVDVDVTLPNNNYSYSIFTDDYTLYQEGLSGSLLETELVGTYTDNGSAASVFSITFTAFDGYVIPSTTSFDPTTSFDDSNDWTETKTYTYNDNGDIVVVKYSYTYLLTSGNTIPNSSTPFDKYVFPSVTMEALVEEPSFVDDSETLQMFTHFVSAGTDGGYSSLTGISQSSLPISYVEGNALSTANGHQIVFSPLPGYILVAASNWSFSSYGQDDITNATFADGPDGTVIATLTFASDQYAESDNEYWQFAIAGNPANLTTSGQETLRYSSLLSVVGGLNYEKPEVTVTTPNAGDTDVSSVLAYTSDGGAYESVSFSIGGAGGLNTAGLVEAYDFGLTPANNQYTLYTVALLNPDGWNSDFDYSSTDFINVYNGMPGYYYIGIYDFSTTATITTDVNTDDTLTLTIKFTPPSQNLTAQDNSLNFSEAVAVLINFANYA